MRFVNVRRGTRAFLLGVLPALALFLAPHTVAAQSPVSTTPVGDYPVPPPSFEELIGSVDLVVYGKVTDNGEPQGRKSDGADYVARFPTVRDPRSDLESDRSQGKGQDIDSSSRWNGPCQWSRSVDGIRRDTVAGGPDSTALPETARVGRWRLLHRLWSWRPDSSRRKDWPRIGPATTETRVRHSRSVSNRKRRTPRDTPQGSAQTIGAPSHTVFVSRRSRPTMEPSSCES